MTPRFLIGVVVVLWTITRAEAARVVVAAGDVVDVPEVLGYAPVARAGRPLPSLRVPGGRVIFARVAAAIRAGSARGGDHEVMTAAVTRRVIGIAVSSRAGGSETEPYPADHGANYRTMVTVVGAGGPADRASLPLATRQGTHIPNERRLEQAPARLRAAINIWTGAYREIRLRSATGIYNCMGLVLASRRTWVYPDGVSRGQLRTVLEEDGYRRLAGPAEVQIGDVVLYHRGEEISHIAVVIEIHPVVATASWQITVVSQWGADGEYIHPLEDVPQDRLGAPSEYWTDRRPAP